MSLDGKRQLLHPSIENGEKPHLDAIKGDGKGNRSHAIFIIFLFVWGIPAFDPPLERGKLWCTQSYPKSYISWIIGNEESILVWNYRWIPCSEGLRNPNFITVIQIFT